jgi:hypothetical protein
MRVTLNATTGDFGPYEPSKGDSVKLGQKVEVITDVCGNDDGICDTSEDMVVEPVGDGSGDDDCICESGETCANGCVINYINVPVYSWSEDQIEFNIPGGSVLDDEHQTALKVTVVKAYDLDPTSPLHAATAKTFVLRQHPRIFSLTPNSGGYGTEVVIAGKGFGTQSAQLSPPYGYQTYVELHTENDVYRVTGYRNNTTLPKTYGYLPAIPPAPPWSNTSIEVKLDNLLDVKTGKRLLDLAQFYEGEWNVKVITDYFKDDGDGTYLVGRQKEGNCSITTATKCFDNAQCPTPQTCINTACTANEELQGLCMGAGRIDPYDTLVYREIGDPMTFTATDDPAVNCVRPAVVPQGNTVNIYGANFGPTRLSTAYVQICTPNMKTCKKMQNGWSNTKIKAKIPTPLPGLPRNVYVQVVQNPGHCSVSIARACDDNIDCINTPTGNCPGTCAVGETCVDETVSNTYQIRIIP